MKNRTNVQVRYICATGSRCPRLKIFGYLGKKTEDRDYDITHLQQGEQMAKEYATKYQIDYSELITTQLENGEHLIIFF